jgi:hypothetical protein
MDSRDMYRQPNLYSPIFQARGLVAFFILTELRRRKKILYFAGHQYGTRFMSPIWRLEF